MAGMTESAAIFSMKSRASGGEGGIRTHGGRKPTPVFETGAIDHSATSPRFGGRLGGIYRSDASLATPNLGVAVIGTAQIPGDCPDAGDRSSARMDQAGEQTGV
jgi:hypothetical protein